MIKRILSYAGTYKKKTIIATILILISVLMSVIPFMLAYQIIEPLVMGSNIAVNKIWLNIAGIFVCLVLHGILYIMGLDFSHQGAYNILMRIRISLQNKTEGLPLGVIKEKGTGTIKRLFVDDVESMEILLAHAIPEGIGNMMIPIVVFITLFVIDWKLALMSLASVAIGMFAMKKMYSMGTKRMGDYYKAGQVMNNTIIEYINGMEVVKVFNKDGESFARFKNDVKNYRDLTIAWYKACWPWMALYNSIIPCTVLLTLPLGSYFVLKGYSTLPDLILVLCMSFSVGVPILKALGFLPKFPQLKYKLDKIEQIIDGEPLKQTKDKFHGRNHTIEFKNVSFAYEDQQVLNGVNMTVKEGQTTALVGESGSGKSTLAKLLVHYYDPKQGSISIGGQNLCDMSLEALNNEISYVSQEQYLFNTSLLENIRVGKLDASDEEVMRAAEKAQCMEFINKLPNGINTLAGDCGKELSGGQRQRISLARAIIKNAPVIVLDEATAFTDPENEEKMNKAIAEVVKGKTLFVIAHKLPSIVNADQICVMNNGRLEAKGTHDELLKRSREYQKLWKASMYSSEWKVASGNDR